MIIKTSNEFEMLFYTSTKPISGMTLTSDRIGGRVSDAAFPWAGRASTGGVNLLAVAQGRGLNWVREAVGSSASL